MKQGRCYGILPMAGKGKRLQPIAFSKELYPLVYKGKHFAVSEFSIKALVKARADEIRLVIHPDKLDLVRYYANYKAPLAMYFNKSKDQPDSVFFPLKSMNDEDICLVGLPDTLFAPLTGFLTIRKVIEGGADLALGLFEVPDGNVYDSVRLNHQGQVIGVKPKYNPPPYSNWVWGIWGGKVKAIREMEKWFDSIENRNTEERILGEGFGWMANKPGIKFSGVKIGRHYVDIGSVSNLLTINADINKFEL